MWSIDDTRAELLEPCTATDIEEPVGVVDVHLPIMTADRARMFDTCGRVVPGRGRQPGHGQINTRRGITRRS